MSENQPIRDRATRSRPLAVARHGRQKHSAAWKSILGIIGGLAVVALVSTGSVAAIAAWQLDQNIEENTQVIAADTEAAPPSIAGYEGGFNILIVGTDTREGQKGLGGSEESGALNDVNMLLHVAEDQQSATLVSLPRDMIVPIPVCSNGGGAAGLPLNNALYYGGLDCVVRTVENLTGLDIQFAGLISFAGVVAMTNAVGGVEVCLTEDIKDKDAGLNLKAGTRNIKGRTALAFLRSRHGVGDGSDLARISSQQVYLSSLVRKMKSSEVLNNPSQLYSLATAATRNISLSRNFGQIDTLVSIALVLKNVPLENIAMVQYPGTTGGTGIYEGKVQPNTYLADQLFAAIKADKAIRLDADSVGNGEGAVLDEKATKKAARQAAREAAANADSTATAQATDSAETTADSKLISGVGGQTADQYTCSQAYQY